MALTQKRRAASDGHWRSTPLWQVQWRSGGLPAIPHFGLQLASSGPSIGPRLAQGDEDRLGPSPLAMPNQGLKLLRGGFYCSSRPSVLSNGSDRT